MSRRSDIRSALVSVLGLTTGGSPYEAGIRKVFTTSVPMADAVAWAPCIAVTDDSESREPFSMRKQQCKITFDVAGISVLRSDSAAIQEIDKVVADIERAIGSDRDLGLGAYGVEAAVSNVDVVRGMDQNMSVCQVAIEVSYQLLRGSP